MTKWYRCLPVVAISILALPVVASAQTEVFFSEYIEGSSNNKALEIYNPTTGAIDLSAGNYSIAMYFNGSGSAGTTIALTGTVGPDDVYVVADNDAVADILNVADQTSTASFFNGDDAVVLLKNGVVIDAIGQVGFDPGSEWGTGDTSTANNTIRRLGTVCEGDPDETDPFDPSAEWVGFAQDVFDGLGTHQSLCTPLPTVEKSWGAVKATY